MKNVLMILVFLTFSKMVLAGDRPFADFRTIIGNETYSGTQWTDYKCRVQTEWVRNGDLEVTATVQYKKNKPTTHQITFSPSKGVEYFIEHGDEDESEHKIEQATDLIQNEDESVYLYESFSVHQDASGPTSLSISVMEVNDHSDPSEILQLSCGDLK